MIKQGVLESLQPMETAEPSRIVVAEAAAVIEHEINMIVKQRRCVSRHDP